MTTFYVVLVGVVILFFALAIKKIMLSSRVVTPLLGWLVGLSFFLILPLAILVLNGGYELPDHYLASGRWTKVDFKDWAYFFPFMLIWTSLMLTALTVLMVTPKISKSSRAFNGWEFSTRKLRIVILACAGIILTNWVAIIFFMGGIQNYFLLHWYTRFTEVYERMGSIFVLYQHIEIALQVVMTAATALLITAIIQRRSRNYGLLCFALFMLLLNMVMTGNRIYIALLFLYIITTILLYRRYRLLLATTMLVPIAIVFFSAWAHIRGGLGDVGNVVENYQKTMANNEVPLMSSFMDATEGINAMILLHIIRDFGSRYDFLLGETYTRSLTFLIPRSVYPEKSESFTVITAKLYEPEAVTSMSSTALGEMYANFGVLTVFLLPLFTLVIYVISNKVTSHLHRNALLSAVLFLLFAWMSRSVFAGNFIILVLSIIIIRGFNFEKNLFHPAKYNELLHSSLR